MLKFLRKFFTKEEEKIEEIKIGELDSWVEEKTKPVFDEAREELKCTIDSFNERKRRIVSDLDALKNMQLSNPDIPIKAKQYMEGNREAYINAITKWIANINFDVNDIKSLRKYVVAFENGLDLLNKETIRSYTILQEFFANESSKIAVGIKGLSDDMETSGKIVNNEKLLRVEKIKFDAKEIKDKLNQKEKLTKMAEEEEIKLEESKKENVALTKNAEDFRQSSDYVKYKQLKEEKEKLLSEIKSYEDDLLQSFSILERALRKYSHIAFEHESSVLDYIASPLKTLAEDKNLILIEILGKMGEFTESGSLKLDEQKRAKTLEEIKKLDRDYLTKYTSHYRESMKKIKDVELQMKEMKLNNKMNELNIKISNSELIIKNISNEIERIKSSIEKLEIEKLLKSTEAGLINFTGKVVVIKVDF